MSNSVKWEGELVVEWVIEVEGLVKEFNGRRVLHDVTFRVGRGEVFGLLGPNGAGKTTTIKILLGLLEPTSGKALVLGGRLSENRELRSRVGVVLEGDGLFPQLTAYENLEFYARVYGLKSTVERDKRIREVLELVGLYETRNVKVGYFSRGMRRRLALARALIHDPDVHFLDEPTLGLDVEGQALVRGLVTKLSREKGATVLYTSHDLNEVERVCSRVALLVGGRIVASGTVESLVSKFSKPLVEVYFTSIGEALKATKYVRGLNYVVECWCNGKSATILVDGSSDIPKLVDDLVRSGFKVVEARRVKRRLEEVYLELVRKS